MNQLRSVGLMLQWFGFGGGALSLNYQIIIWEQPPRNDGEGSVFIGGDPEVRND